MQLPEGGILKRNFNFYNKNMNRAINFIKALNPRFWVGAVISRLIYFEKDRQSINLSIIPYKIKRREDVRKQYGEYKNVEFFYLRISKLRGLEYISIRIAYFIFINIDFHRPI